MAPPALASLDNFSDVQFRDVVGRHQYQVAPAANIIHKLYNHVSGNTANVSVADVVSIDGSSQGQWDLMLSTSGNRLDANVITTENTAAWSANSMISVREATTTIRSKNVAVNDLVVAGNLSLPPGGVTQLGQMKVTSLTVVVPAGGNSSIGICEILSSGYYAELVLSGSANKSYAFSPGSNMAAGVFNRMIPFVCGSSFENVVVEINYRFVSGTTYSTKLRFVNISTTEKIIACTLKTYEHDGNPVTVVPYTETLTVAPTTTIWPHHALLTQKAGRVGIGTDLPVQALDVVGNVNASTAYRVGNVQVLSGTTLGSSITSSNLNSVGTLTSLNVTGNATAGNISTTGALGGTLSTAAQPNITTVGTLTSLAVTGNVSGGNISTTGALGGTLSTAAQPNITSVGTLTSLAVTGNVTGGNVTVGANGVAKLDNCIIRSFNRDLGTTINDSVEVCGITGGNGLAYVAELSVVQGEDNDGTQPLNGAGSFAKHYRFVVSNATTTAGGWRRLVPLQNDFQDSFILEINHSQSSTLLRLVRINSQLFLYSFECTLTLRQSRNSAAVTITSLSGASTGVTPSTALFQNSRISQTNNRVGINTDNPAFPLDVVGNTNITGILSVTGNMTGGNISTTGALGGTLSTAAQPNITTIGTLSSLAVAGNVTAGNITVTGDINFDTPTFKLDSTLDRVGIATTTPQFTLDVNGDLNANVYRVGGTEVLSGTALGAGVLSSNLTSVGTLTSLNVSGNVSAGNLTVNTGGRTQLDSFVMQTFSKALPTAVPAYLGICEITSADGFVAELEIVQGATGIAKSYKFAVSGATPNSTSYRRLIPFMTAGNIDAAVSIRHSKGTVTSTTLLRLHRINPGAAGDIECTVKVYQSRDSPVTILENADAGSTAEPTDYWGENSLITQRNGDVGIGTDNPTRELTVVGTITTSSRYEISGATVLNSTTLGENIVNSSLTKVGTLSSLNVAGNISLSSGAFDFASKWRLQYDSTDDALVIERNNGTAVAPDWVRSAVLAQM
jgi:hypothetical protein